MLHADHRIPCSLDDCTFARFTRCSSFADAARSPFPSLHLFPSDLKPGWPSILLFIHPLNLTRPFCCGWLLTDFIAGWCMHVSPFFHRSPTDSDANSRTKSVSGQLVLNEKLVKAALAAVFSEQREEDGLWPSGQPIFLSQGKRGAVVQVSSSSEVGDAFVFAPDMVPAALCAPTPVARSILAGPLNSLPSSLTFPPGPPFPFPSARESAEDPARHLLSTAPSRARGHAHMDRDAPEGGRGEGVLRQRDRAVHWPTGERLAILSPVTGGRAAWLVHCSGTPGHSPPSLSARSQSCTVTSAGSLSSTDARLPAYTLTHPLAHPPSVFTLIQAC